MADKNTTGTNLTLRETLGTALQTESLPKGFDVTRFVNNAIHLITKNDTLVKFANQYGAKGTMQIKNELLKAARLGLDCSVNEEFYLYPYGSNLNLSLSPRGAAKIARKYSAKPVLSGPFTKIHYQGESFQEIYLDNGIPWFEHKPLPKEETAGKPIIGAFAYILFTDGDRRYEYMTIDEINACKAHSKAANQGPWKSFPERMISKTVLHRLCRNLDIEYETVEQAEAFLGDMAIETDARELRNNAIEQTANTVDFEPDVIDAEVKEVKESKKAEKPKAAPFDPDEPIITPFA